MVSPLLQGDSWKGNFIFWSVHGELISKEAKSVPHDISSSLNILLYPGELLASPVMSLVL